jgi:surface polysaccharide O-acyltransferase-like enzyme
MLSAPASMLFALDSNERALGALAGGFAVVWVLFFIALVIFSIYCCWRVAMKCGYPGAYSLLLLLPVINIIVQLVWVFSEWPIEAELKRARAGALQRPS